MTDAKQQINQVRRTLGDRTIEAGEALVATISQVYPTDIDDLWEVVTNPERIVRWFAPVSGELKEGGHYQVEGNANGTITRCDKPRGYAATWEFAGQVSWIEVRLTPDGDGTRFELEHVALAQFPSDFWDRYGPGATGVGWDLSLLGLSRHISDPAAVPDPEEIATWHTTEEGRTFLRLASDRWAEVAATYGVAEAEAKAQGDRTYAFYTGTEEGEAPAH
jgi:uncharacterized protein YndB with AHSA1/START domain